MDGWLAGPVLCAVCDHGWVAVRPAETSTGDLECPKCGSQAAVEREDDERV